MYTKKTGIPLYDEMCERASKVVVLTPHDPNKHSQISTTGNEINSENLYDRSKNAKLLPKPKVDKKNNPGENLDGRTVKEGIL